MGTLEDARMPSLRDKQLAQAAKKKAAKKETVEVKSDKKK